MTLSELIEQLDSLSHEELRLLREELDQRLALKSQRAATAEERINRLQAVAQAIREGFTDPQWAEIERAMNEEHIEPFDEAQWKA